MKKKLFTLLTLLLCLCSGAWADPVTATFSGDNLNIVSTNSTQGAITLANAGKASSFSNGELSVSSSGTAFTITAKDAKISQVVIHQNSSNARFVAPTGGTLGSRTASDISNYYQQPITYSTPVATTTISSAGSSSKVKKIVVTYTENAVKSPTITPNGGDVLTTQTFTLSTTTNGADIYYTIDGTDPTAGSTKYTTPFTISTLNELLQIKAIAIKETEESQITISGDIYVSTSPAKSTWDLTSITSSDLSSTWWNGTQNRNSITANTDATMLNNHGFDLCNGITIGRTGNSIASAKIDLFAGQGIRNNNTSGYFKIPVESGKKYKVTYMTNSAGKSVGFTITSGATVYEVEGESLTQTLAKTSDKGYVTLTATAATIMLTISSTNTVLSKVEELASGPTLSVSPSSANAFTYVVGNGPSAAQTLTVTGENLTSTITATLSNTDAYEMRTGENAFAAGPLTDLASGTAIQVRLKAGLAKGDSYNGNLTFSTTGADNKVIALTGSVTGQIYDITKGSATNGSIEVASSAEGGATVDISAAGETGYEFSSWNIYKTGEPATTIDPAAATASTTFTMPAYPVTVDATFAAKTYTVTLNNQSATIAGTASVTTTYNANTNLTSSITCPEKSDYVFMGYYTAADGEGKRLIDNSGAWIASVSGYTDADKNWLNDGDVTLYACWMKYATSADFNVYAYANLAYKAQSGTWTPLDDNNFAYSLYNNSNKNTSLDHSENAPYVGLKIKNSSDYIKFAVPAGKQVTVIFGYVKDEKPKLSIDGGAETDINITLASDNQIVYYAQENADRIFKIKPGNSNATVIKKIFIEDASTEKVTATVGANGYTTFASPYALDLTDANRPAGLKAYKATLEDGAELKFVELNQKVPAGTGLLLLGETKGGDYDIPVVAEAGTAAESNALIGITAVTAMKSTADDNYFFVMRKAADAESALSFAPLATTAVNVPAGKVVIEVPNSAFPTTGSARELTYSFEKGNTTGINTLDNLTNSQFDNDAPMYNLAGQKVGKSYKGIVIVNGKKFMNK